MLMKAKSVLGNKGNTILKQEFISCNFEQLTT